MATDTDAICPVCGEPLPDRPPSCFRCETPLGHWWSLYETLQGAEAGLADAARADRRGPPRIGAAWAWAGLPALAIGLAIGAALYRRPAAPPAPLPRPPAAAPAVAPPPVAPAPVVLRYRVQAGDSLWRIAAALTGDGHRWRELWPERARQPDALRPGTILEVRGAPPTAAP